MWVVLASHRYPPATGGSERIAELIATGLVRRGHRVTVVTAREPSTREREERDGVEVIRLPLRPIGGVRVPVRYLRTLRSLPADLFHLTGNRIWCADFYLPFQGLFEWPVVVTGHGFYQYAIHPRWWDRWYFERYYVGRLRRVAAYAAISELERSQLIRWGLPPGRIERVPNGIDLAEFTPPADPPADVREAWGLTSAHLAVYVGGFFENKRVDRLVRALAARDGRWGLVVYGPDRAVPPYDAASVGRLAAELKVPFRWMGVRPRPEVRSALRAADVVALGSSYEGFGLLLLEAMASARPFVSFDVGVARELAETGAGQVVRTEAEFGAALAEYESAESRAVAGARGRAAVPRWSAEAMVDRYLRVYDRVRAHRSAPSEVPG